MSQPRSPTGTFHALRDIGARSTETRRVLVLHTGGTIGMVRSEHGYVPAAGQLAERVRALHQLHERGASGLLLPSLNLGSAKPAHTGRVTYEIEELETLLDSANMAPVDWINIAHRIAARYADFDAFVVLHGTDTMAYTASALSFMFEGADKPIILTGSQIPLSEPRNDAIANLQGALGMAGHFDIPEVCVYFGDRLLRGNRARKVSTAGFDAFESPNYEPLVEVGVDVAVHHARIRPRSGEAFRLLPMGKHIVGALRVFPGLGAETLHNFVQPPLAGLVLETYGTGNIPVTRPELLEVLRHAIDRGVVVVNCTQCLRGAVVDAYEAGSALERLGVVGGRDLTPEAALTKLSWLLEHADSHTAVRWLMARNLRGELTSAR